MPSEAAFVNESARDSSCRAFPEREKRRKASELHGEFSSLFLPSGKTNRLLGKLPCCVGSGSGVAPGSRKGGIIHPI